MTRKTLTAVLLGLGLIFASGCGKKAQNKPGDDTHEHGEGPHGGVILEFGKYHGEFKPDHKKKEATVWMLKGDAKTAARVKADKVRLVISNTKPPIEIDLLPTDRAEDGTASEFVGKHDGFAVEMEYQGTVSVEIDGKPYSWDFKEEPEKKK